MFRDEGTAHYWFQQDHEGSVTHVTDDAGNVVESYRYDAFGAPSFFGRDGKGAVSSSFNNRFLFTGREYQATFGIYEYRNRAYHPGLGRFMSEDPKGFDAGDYNLYRYCGNDPEDRVDPMGLGPWAVTDTGAPVGHDGMAGAYGPGAADRIEQMEMAQQNTARGERVAQGLQRQQTRLMAHRRAVDAARAYVTLALEQERQRSITRHGNLHIDTDGTGDRHLDPKHRDVTSFTRDGVSLNADVDPYVALPTRMQRLGVRAGDPVVLTGNGRSAPGIVGDFGSPGFVEASVALAHGMV